MKNKSRSELMRSKILVDSKYEFLLSRYTWTILKSKCTYYAVTRFYKNRKHESLHRLIMILEGYEIKGKEVDHRDGNGLNNQLENLRIATISLSRFNRKWDDDVGATFHKASGKYQVRIGVDSKRINLGLFDTQEEAIEARKEAELKYFGESTRR